MSLTRRRKVQQKLLSIKENRRIKRASLLVRSRRLLEGDILADERLVNLARGRQRQRRVLSRMRYVMLNNDVFSSSFHGAPEDKRMMTTLYEEAHDCTIAMQSAAFAAMRELSGNRQLNGPYRARLLNSTGDAVQRVHVLLFLKRVPCFANKQSSSVRALLL